MRPLPEDLLESDERLLWHGSPNADRLLMRIDYLMIPAGFICFIVGFVLAVYAMAGLANPEDRSYLYLFQLTLGLALLPLSWHLAIGHLIRRRRRALRTLYLVTDRRVVRSEGKPGGSTSTFDVRYQELPIVTVKPQYQGRATIHVGPVALYNIEDHVRVESLIRQQLPAERPS